MKLINVSYILEANMLEIIDVVNEDGDPVNGKVSASRLWRIIRSVILVAAVGALIAIVAIGTAPVWPAIIGAIIMGSVSLTDAILNDYCHFAMQCDGGWRQDCTSGVCAPY